MTDGTSGAELGTAATSEIRGNGYAVTEAAEPRVSTLASSALPRIRRVFTAHGVGVKTVTVPLDLRLERRQQLHMVANLGLETEPSTPEG